MGIIEVEDLEKSYQLGAQQVKALKGVSFTIQEGAMVAVSGRSGSGKSTLLHLLGTLDRPSKGSIRIQDQDVTQMSDTKISSFRNKAVGFVFQMNNLLPEFSAIENVMMPGLIARAPREKVEEKAATLLESVGLGHRVSHRPSELSGGEQQRVAIARALLMDPPILLADEPTGNLDKRNSLAIQDLLMNLCKSHKVTMLLVTHDMELSANLPQTIVLEDGKILEMGGSW